MIVKKKGYAIILAAGHAARFGGNKLVAHISSKSLIEYTLTSYLDIRNLLDGILVVINPNNTELKSILTKLDVNIIENEKSESGGMSSSILKALDFFKISRINPHFLFIQPGDIPKIRAEDLQLLLTMHFETHSGIIIPQYNNKAGHPLLISGKLFHDLNQINEKTLGLRGFLANHKAEIYYSQSHNPYILEDVDTEADFERIFSLDT
ncbi:MAG: nucleotidyltransferase family protein [Candidatus Heimdallarchaeota archaeon]|nr:nucleotidyltransferase family protein [Candidatus Heimdallarchaeota archaeon]